MKKWLNGLVLSGGKSSRMGIDKGALIYDQTEFQNQRVKCFELLNSICDRTYVSLGKTQAEKIVTGFPILLDQVDHLGPISGLLSAHCSEPEAAWFVLACDFPFADVRSIHELVQNRTEPALVHYYQNKNLIPEPLFAIWEALALKVLEKQFRQGNLSPLDCIKNLPTRAVRPYSERVLINVNTPEEFHQTLNSLV